jgi:signal transduction histidine kinase
VATFLAAIWLLYRFRLSQIAHEHNVRVEERVGERTRIARDLHDTLLQSFQGSLFEFQAARNLFSRRPEDAIHSLDEAICSADAAIAEGRDAIQDLRSGYGVRGDLLRLLTATAQELSEAQASNGNGTRFRVTVEGTPHLLSPALQNEVYRIGREILRNAFRHARAKQIEVEIRYDHWMLRLRIRDDGIGIDPQVLKEGARGGHWGLPGIRERAKLVGARLDFWSEAGAGTEVQITIPASVAYLRRPDIRIFRFFRKSDGAS